MRWHYRDPPLVWLLVAASALESVEEWAGYGSGLPTMFRSLAGLLIGQAAALLVTCAAATAAVQQERRGWAVAALAASLLSHALLHAASSMVMETYSPGLLASVIVSLPLALLVLLRAWLQTPLRCFLASVAAGAGLHAGSFLLAIAVER